MCRSVVKYLGVQEVVPPDQKKKNSSLRFQLPTFAQARRNSFKKDGSIRLYDVIESVHALLLTRGKLSVVPK